MAPSKPWNGDRPAASSLPRRDRGVLDPLAAGVGVHELTYTLGDTAVTCTVEVTETPDATMTSVEPVCANTGAFTLEAGTEGGGLARACSASSSIPASQEWGRTR